jgi:hypothetical protein
MRAATVRAVIEESEDTYAEFSTHITRSGMTLMSGTESTMASPLTPSDAYELRLTVHSPTDSHSHGRTTPGEISSGWEGKDKKDENIPFGHRDSNV